jgi:prolyl oligopeptidase
MSGRQDEDKAYYGFSNYITPSRIYETSIATGKTKLWTKVDVPVADPETYTVKRVWYKSKDGTRVSMFVVHRKDLELTGDAPTILYGYGGFNVSLTPYFSRWIHPWLENGGVYAVPHLRGGGEYGEAWHKAGALANKQNVFDDFNAAAHWLFDNGYTSPKSLVIHGRSNGGLLVGAAMTQWPEDYAAVLCGVPLLDMVRYHKFGSGRTWISEYGTAEKAEQFKVLHGYSPYHRVVDGTKYPAMLMLATDGDDRVDPLHARKFTAAIQHANGGDAPVLLRVERNAGHGGADLITRSVHEWADIYAFLTWTLKLPYELETRGHPHAGSRTGQSRARER